MQTLDILVMVGDDQERLFKAEIGEGVDRELAARLLARSLQIISNAPVRTYAMGMVIDNHLVMCDVVNYTFTCRHQQEEDNNSV